MKLLLISYHYSFSDSTGSLRPRAMSKYLPPNGVDVAVLTYRAQNEAVSYLDNIIGVKDITRDTVNLPVYYAWRIWQKGLQKLGFYRSAHEFWRDTALNHADEIINRVKPDAILASYPSIEALEIGATLSEKYGLPFISDFRDGLLYEPVEADRLRQPAVRRQFEALEARIIRISHLVLTVSEPISAYFRKYYAHPEVITLHNGFDPNDILPDMSTALPSGVINIVHTGRLGTSEKGRDADALSVAVETLLARKPESALTFKLHFVGQLSQEEQTCLAPLVDKGVVTLWGHQPRAISLGFQRQADALLLITAPDKASIATGKLFEYLAANKPILALTRGTEAERIVREARAGLIASPDKPEEITAVLEELLSTFHALSDKRDEAQIIKFSRVQQMKTLAEKIESILKHKTLVAE